MAVAMEYPGTPHLRRAAAQGPGLQAGQLEAAWACRRACLEALRGGMRLVDRVQAARLWLRAWQAAPRPVVDAGGQPDAAAELEAVLQAGLVDALDLTDADTLDAGCHALDQLGAAAVTGVADVAVARALAGDLGDRLPLPPELTWLALAGHGRGDLADDPPPEVPDPDRLLLAARHAGAAEARKAALLAESARRGLHLLDAALHGEHYDAALAATACDGLVRLDLGEVSRLCLDETPLFREAGLEPLVALVTEGLPARDAARYALRLAAVAEALWELPWQGLVVLCPTLLESAAWVDHRVQLELARRRSVAAADLLQHAVERGVIDAVEAQQAWHEVADQLAAEGDLQTVAMLGESLAPALPTEAADLVARRTVEALVCLADDADGEARWHLLQRARALAPDSEVIARRIESTEALRSGRRWLRVAVVAWSIGIAAATVLAIQLPV